MVAWNIPDKPGSSVWTFLPDPIIVMVNWGFIHGVIMFDHVLVGFGFLILTEVEFTGDYRDNKQR